jgi:adenylate cyclase
MRVLRTFSFVDLSGFTRFTDIHGDDEAVAVLSCFRSVVRSIGSDFGVRIAKWLGDGAMFVAVDGAALVDGVLELESRLQREEMPLPLRAGLATGNVILFEGDDYTGHPVNLAARLCDLASPYEVLVTEGVAAFAPDGVHLQPVGEREIAGLVAPVPVVRVLRPEAPDPVAESLGDA